MALIACAECGKQISDRATACPGCGCPIPAATPPSSGSPGAPAAGSAAPGVASGTPPLRNESDIKTPPDGVEVPPLAVDPEPPPARKPRDFVASRNKGLTPRQIREREKGEALLEKWRAEAGASATPAGEPGPRVAKPGGAPPSAPPACPACGATDTARCATVHESGTAIVESASTHLGAAWTDEGLTPVLAGSSTRGRTQTALAKRLAPPDKKPAEGYLYGGGGCLAVLALALIGALMGAAKGESVPVGVWVVLGVGALLAVGALGQGAEMKKWNDEEWPRLRKRWAAEWCCLRCGRVFTPRDGG